MANPLFRLAMWLTFERWAKRNSYQHIKTQIETEAKIIHTSIQSATQNKVNHQTTTHIIGMERWIQSRIKVALGSPYIQEEYDNYRPPQNASWEQLEQEFIATRELSCELCDQLIAENIDKSLKVNHNQFGNITIGAWLEYLNFHSKTHAKSIKSD
ncbi:MAG: hypothetical protein AAF846_02435 [Chloroflexota bacterium]